MAVSIDWATFTINVPRADMILVQSSPTEIRELNLNDLRTVLKGLESSMEGIGFPKTHDHYTAVQVGGVELAHVLVILAPYTVTFEDGQYAVNLVGANSNVGDRVNVNQVSVRSANSAGLAQTRDIEFASFGSAVHIDSIHGNDLNKGNEQYPVQTVARAAEVLAYRGFTNVHVLDTMVFGPDAIFPTCHITGDSKLVTMLTIQPGANVDQCTFKNLTITGALDQNVMIENCVIENLDYVEGDIHNCEITGILKVAGANGLEIFNSYSGRKGPIDPAVIDMDGPNTGAKNVAIHNWSGHMRVRNMTGGYLGISCSGTGHVRIESTCTGGYIHLMGNMKVINQTGGATVATNYLTDQASIAAAMRAYSTAVAASPNTVGKQWEDAAAGGGGGGGSSAHEVWAQAIPADFVDGSAGLILDQIRQASSTFNAALARIMEQKMEGSVVLANPSTIDGLTLYQYNDYPEFELTLGPEWTPYLDGSYLLYFSIKQSILDEVLTDVPGVIRDVYSGTIGFPLTKSDLAMTVGPYMWQVQLRKPDPNPDLPPLTIKVAAVGHVQIRPLFKPVGTSSVPAATGVYVLTVSADYTAVVEDFNILADSTLTVTLPLATGLSGKLFRIKNIGAGVVTIAASGADTIDGAPSIELSTQYASVEVVSSGSAWILM